MAKIGVHRDQPAAAVLGRSIAQLDHAGWINHHVPGQLGDLNRAEARLGGQQDDDTVAEGMPGAAGKDKEVVDVAKREYFCLLASHREP